MVDEGFTILEQVPTVVKINVGGTEFMTSRNTLYNGCLKALREHLGKSFCAMQNSPVYFLDRDPKHFQRILNYLRDGSCVLPASREEKQELLVEAQFYEILGLADLVSANLRDYANIRASAFDFESMVLQHHAQTGKLESCMHTLLTFVKESLVKITPVSDVSSDNLLVLYWLSPTMPPSDPSHIVFRYRGANESHEVGRSVAKGTAEFADWNRLWDVWRNKELMTAFTRLAIRNGLKVYCKDRTECFKDNQLDVKWKMYRVRSLSLSIGADKRWSERSNC